MTLNFFQILIISAWAFWGIIDALAFGWGFNMAILASLFTGVVVGNPTYGLVVGGTLQMTQLGAGTYGGASIPNITSSGMITTALGAAQVSPTASLADISASAVTLAASIGIAMAALFTELDILARFSNTYFQHRADKYVGTGDTKGIERMNTLGILPWGLSRALPVFFMLLFGQGLIEAIIDFIPVWLMDGFKIAGGILPVVGFAILMRYLPVSKKPQYLILGFVLSAYLKMPTLGVALIGMVAAMIIYQQAIAKNTANVQGDDEDE
ncbi:MAG: PTS mannose/fructose/sorbose/N-acetylgalactosamine transporter subunit IIC [Bulleidia sp.]